MVLAICFTLLPSTLFAAPSNLNPYTLYDLTSTLITADETHPYGSTLLTFKIDSLPRYNDTDCWYIGIEKKIGDAGEWFNSDELSSDQMVDYCQTSPGVFEFE